MVKRTSPNIIITGTPGVGKTTHAQLLAQNCAGELKHLAINQVAKERDCYDGKDEELGSWIVDEDKLLDAIEPDVLRGGNIIDWHACDLFPRSWIDLVVVVRADRPNPNHVHLCLVPAPGACLCACPWANAFSAPDDE